MANEFNGVDVPLGQAVELKKAQAAVSANCVKCQRLVFALGAKEVRLFSPDVPGQSLVIAKDAAFDTLFAKISADLPALIKAALV